MGNGHRAPWGCIYSKEDISDCKHGKRPQSDQEYFEIFSLCILQTGLSWGSIRKNWGKHREGFYGFDINRLSKVTSNDLLKKPNVIKNKEKVEAIIYNAKEFQWIKKEYGSFYEFLRSLKEKTKEELVRLLMEQFKHVGEYTIEYYLHSVGYWK